MAPGGVLSVLCDSFSVSHLSMQPVFQYMFLASFPPPLAYSQSFVLPFPPVSFCFLVTVTFPLPSPLSSSLIQSHHSHRSSLTLIRRRRYRSALWDWRKKGLIPYLRSCVCVCGLLYACLRAHPSCLCEIGRYWSEYIRGFNGAVLNFHFSLCRKRSRRQD